MDLHLTDEQAELLLAELDNIINNDRYPLSPRVRALREIRALLKPYPEHPPAPPPQKPYEPPSRGRPVPQATLMKPYRGPLTTLGNAATAKVRVIVWRESGAKSDPGSRVAQLNRFDPQRIT